MNSELLDRMRARVREVRSRAAVRKWNYRQRDLAAGVLFRLRRVLADAKEIYLISPEDAAILIQEGYASEPVGSELAPEKTLIFINRDRLERIESKRQIAVRLSPDFLLAPAAVLIPFELPKSTLKASAPRK